MCGEVEEAEEVEEVGESGVGEPPSDVVDDIG